MYASGLEESKCPTVDGVPNVVYKFANALLYKLLAKFYSSLMIHGYVPNSLSVIEITPILKNALKDPTTSNNYRPISISSTGSKILERIILRRMSEFLGTTDHQFGFKEGTSPIIFFLLLD